VIWGWCIIGQLPVVEQLEHSWEAWLVQERGSELRLSNVWRKGSSMGFSWLRSETITYCIHWMCNGGHWATFIFQWGRQVEPCVKKEGYNGET